MNLLLTGIAKIAPSGLLFSILNEIAFYVLCAILLLPFMAVDAAILKKIYAISNRKAVFTKKFNIIKTVVCVAVTLAVASGVGCLMYFGFKIDLPENDWAAFALFAIAVSALGITLCAFNFYAYKKLQKQAARAVDKDGRFN